MTESKDLDLVGKLSEADRRKAEFRIKSISPDEGKYASATDKLRPYLSAEAEWLECVHIQTLLLETRAEFGQASDEDVFQAKTAYQKMCENSDCAINMGLLEDKVTKHDQLAVLEEMGVHAGPKVKALLHPGTTSYDILDTARSYLFREAWYKVMRPEITKSVEQLCTLAERSFDRIQVGRTHLQDTSPVPFGVTLAGYAKRLAGRVDKCDDAFNNLKGKISGMVGTGASVEMVIGKGKSLEFEKKVLAKLRLEPDYAATQIVQKEALADAGHGLTTLMHVLADFTNDIRMLYSSAINEVTSRDNAERLGGSSADATKNNPIQYENMTGKAAVVESGMRILYEMIHSDFQRDLRGSVQARYQPQAMMVQTYEAFSRLNKSLPQLSINEDRMEKNLTPVRENPSEAMVAILRGAQWVHPKYGVGHDFVKEIGKRAKKEKRRLMDVALEDDKFRDLTRTLPEHQVAILNGQLELYVGSSVERGKSCIDYARKVCGGK